MGLNVVSVSLDNDREKWLKALNEDQVSWLQLVDLEGFKKSKVRADYKVERVPAVYLRSPPARESTDYRSYFGGDLFPPANVVLLLIRSCGDRFCRPVLFRRSPTFCSPWPVELFQGVTVLPIHTFKLPSAACNRVKSTHSSYKTILPTFYLKDGCLYLLEKTETLSGWERMTYL